jgi:hypothetical protein
MGGIVWGFCVSESGVPDILRNSYIKENGRFWLLPMNADPFLINFSQKALAAGNVTWTDVEAVFFYGVFLRSRPILTQRCANKRNCNDESQLNVNTSQNNGLIRQTNRFP